MCSLSNEIRHDDRTNTESENYNTTNNRGTMQMELGNNNSPSTSAEVLLN